MRYLLDGYNVLFLQEDFGESLEEQRNRLLEKLHGLKGIEFIVVFDAHRQEGIGERHHFADIEVVYTDFNQTADQYILEYVERLSLGERGQTKVVTSDKALKRMLGFEKIEVLSGNSFFQKMRKKTASQSPE